MFGTSDDFVFFSILLHVATLFAVIIVQWKDVKFLIKHPFSRPAQMIYLATIPTVIIVILFKGVFEDAFSGGLLPICFAITAVLLATTQLFAKNVPGKNITPKTSILVGMVQGLAVLPGISRSGSTICTAVLCGVSKEKASSFSFLLSIPIILASIASELLDAITTGQAVLSVPIVPTITAAITAFVVGCISIKFMLSMFQKVSLWWFVGYLLFISAVSLFV